MGNKDLLLYSSVEKMPCNHHTKNSPTGWRRAKREIEVPNQSHQVTNESKLLDFEVPSSMPEPCPPESISELVQLLEQNPKNLDAVSKFVQNHNGKSIELENGKYYLCVGDLNSTIYMGQKFMQEAWEELYLPKETKMQVFGTLESTGVMHSCVEWIILVGEDGCIYAYSEEELQLIARSLSEFLKNGKRNCYEFYLYPEGSEDEPEEQDEEILKIRQRTREFVNKNANELDDFFSFISS